MEVERRRRRGRDRRGNRIIVAQLAERKPSASDAEIKLSATTYKGEQNMVTFYRTEDGMIFDNEGNAVIHAKLIDFNNNGGFDSWGKPYVYSKVDRSHDLITWF